MVDFEVKQDVYIGGANSGWEQLAPFYDSFDVLQNQDRTVIKAGHEGKVTKNMSLNLSNIHYVVNGNKNCRRGWSTGRRAVPRSKEEIF